MRSIKMAMPDARSRLPTESSGQLDILRAFQEQYAVAAYRLGIIVVPEVPSSHPTVNSKRHDQNNTMHNTHTAEISSTLEGIRQKVNEAIDSLQSPEISKVLEDELHNPEQLPNAALMQLSADVVDRLEQLQMMLIPSVSLLADGFFGKSA